MIIYRLSVNSIRAQFSRLKNNSRKWDVGVEKKRKENKLERENKDKKNFPRLKDE